jgi:hypothetical protein
LGVKFHDTKVHQPQRFGVTVYNKKVIKFYSST